MTAMVSDTDGEGHKRNSAYDGADSLEIVYEIDTESEADFELGADIFIDILVRRLRARQGISGRGEPVDTYRGDCVTHKNNEEVETDEHR